VGVEPPTPRFQSPIANSQSPISNLSSDGWLHVLAGGVLGFLLSWPLGILCAAPPSTVGMLIYGLPLMVPVPVLIGLPLAAMTAALMFGWIRDGRLPRMAARRVRGGPLGRSVGGWRHCYAGRRGNVFGCFWPWGSMADGSTCSARPRMGSAGRACGSGDRMLQHGLRASASLSAELRLAERESARAAEHLEKAARADPLSAEPWRQLAAIEFETWSREPSEAAVSRFARAIAKALDLSPNSAVLWLNAGDWEFRAFPRRANTEKGSQPETPSSCN